MSRLIRQYIDCQADARKCDLHAIRRLVSAGTKACIALREHDPITSARIQAEIDEAFESNAVQIADIAERLESALAPFEPRKSA